MFCVRVVLLLLLCVAKTRKNTIQLTPGQQQVGDNASPFLPDTTKCFIPRVLSGLDGQLHEAL